MANITPNTKEEQDAAYSPEERAHQSAKTLHDSEQREAFDRDFENPNRLAKDGVPSDLAGGARQAEENPTSPPRSDEFINNVTGKLLSAVTKKPFLKGKGPLLFIGGGVGLGGVAIFLLIVPALLFFHLLANMFDTFDPSATALTQVTKRMVLNKLGANDATLGACNVIKIACRFKTPSNELLRQLRENGITPLDAKGKPMEIDLKKKWPTQRPSAYEVSSFHSASGETLTIDAKNLKSALQNETTFRMAFNKTVKKIGARAFSRLSPAFLQVIDGFKINLRDKLGIKERTTQAGKRSIGQIIADALKLRGLAGEAVEGTEKAASLITSKISLRVSKLLTDVGKTGKGSIIVLAMAMQCMANEIPGMIKKTMISMQEVAMISAGTPVVTGMSAIKAGDGDPETATDLGNMWTEQTSDGKSALNSAGVNYALYGDKNTSSDPTYNNVMPAAFGDTLTYLDIADMFVNNPISSAECTLLMNPVTGAAIAAGINVAVAGSSAPTFGVSFAVNLILGVAMSAAIDTFSGNISDLVGSVVAPGLGAITQSTLDNMNKPGPTRGNVVTSTVGALSEHTGAETFGTALTTKKLALYSKDIQAQRLADAELDKATLSPFDASSRYTFLGSMVNQLMPYYSSLTSIQGGLSVIGSLLPISFGSLLKTSTAGAATDPANLYVDACPDSERVTAVNGEKLAADIFCHVAFAMIVPDSWDPNTTMTAMENMSGAIDNETGEAIVDNSVLSNLIEDSLDFSTIIPDAHLELSYGDWLDTCTNPENATQCTGDDDTQNTYGLYTAARTVNAMLDMDPTDEGGDLLVATDTVDKATPKSIASLFGIVPSLSSLYRTYDTSVSTPLSTPTLLTDPLTRFALWR